MREEVAAHYRSKGYTIRDRVQVRGRSGTVHAVEMVAQGPLGNLVIAFEDAGGIEGPEISAVRRAARDIGATPVVAARRLPDNLRRMAAQAGVVLLDDEALHAPATQTPAASDELEYPPWPDGPTHRDVDASAAWPDAARPAAVARSADSRGKSTDPGFWRYPRPRQTVQMEPQEEAVQAAPPARPKASFDWLPRDTAEPAATQTVAGAPAATLRSPAPRTHATQGATGNRGPMRAEADASATTTGTVYAGRLARAPALPVPRTSPLWRWAAAGAGFGASAGAVFYALAQWLG